MTPPSEFSDGFGAKTIIGSLFLGLFMLPGSMYLTLFMGVGLGPAARWVTVILFAEVARRSLKSLRQQEVFILFYMTGIALSSPFQGWAGGVGLLWNQYLVQSDVAQAMGIAPEIPDWVAPSPEVIQEAGNTFFTWHWVAPILLLSFQLIITRVNGFGLGYALYRLTAHGEKLPFPMAPVAGQAVLALTDDKSVEGQRRWTTFATGGVMGMIFGFIYVGIPSLSGSLLGTPYQLIPIPWLDLTAATEEFLPATPTNIVFDMTLLVLGMVLPFWAVVGGFIGLLVRLLLNPFLHYQGILTSWRPGMRVVDTIYANTIDFYLSFGIGLTLAIFFISAWGPAKTLFKHIFLGKKGPDPGVEAERSSAREVFAANRIRGDISIWLALGVYVVSTAAAVIVCRILIPDFPWMFFAIFGFVYIPIISYASAKLEGLVGQALPIPFVREAAFILSGYKGIAIWFAPLPIVSYGMRTREFRVMELTGTRVGSVIKTEILTIPIVIIGCVLFSQFIWRLGPIPSEAYPFTQEVWKLRALSYCLTYTATMPGGSKFIEAIDPIIIGYSLGGGIASFAFLSWLGLPTFLLFGFVRGLGMVTPGHLLPQFAGALIGRFYFQKRFGRKRWRRIIPVFMAGFTCGVGLMAMASVGTALIAKSISTLLY